MPFLLLIAILFFAFPSVAIEWQDEPKIGALFDRAEVTGTFVVFDVTSQRYLGYDQRRAEARFVPASTYKIPHTLIGLSVGAVQDVDEILPYGGETQPFKTWEKDMGLRDAIAISNVPIYKALARRIGLQSMADNVAKLDYGNKKIGASVDTFWLVGPLKISAVEQTQFLARLAQGTLPYPKEHQASVREIIRVDQGSGWSLYAKSGWENAPDAGAGWWVGWVEKETRIYPFALNLDIRKSADGAKREALTRASLRALGILP